MVKAEPRARRFLAAAAAVAAGLLALHTLRTVPPGLLTDAERERSGPGNYSTFGEILLHKLPTGKVSSHVPASSALGALLFEHLPPSAQGTWRVGAVALTLALVYAVAAALGGPAGGIAANALFLSDISLLWGEPLFVHYFMSLWVLLVAGLAAWREQDPTPRRSAAVGLAVGTSFLFRSVFVLLPPLLALRALLLSRGEPPRRRAAHVLALGLLPYLLLGPWAAMNWKVHRELVLFERGESIPVVVMGALGFLEQDALGEQLGATVVRDALDKLGGQALRPLLIWAARETLSHPARTAGAIVARSRLIAAQHPLLLLAALAALVWLRRSRPYQAAGLVAAYFFGVHALLPYCQEFYTPMWVLAAVIACAAAARAALLSAGPFSCPPAAARTLLGSLGAAALLALWASAKVDAFRRAWPGDMTTALPRAAAERPGDAILQAQAGALALELGDFEEAERRLAAALALRPSRFDWKLRLAWARMLLRGAEPPALSEASVFGDVIDLGVLRAQWRWAAGKPELARREIAAAIERANADMVDRCEYASDRRLCRVQASKSELELWGAFPAAGAEIPGLPDEAAAGRFLDVVYSGLDLRARALRAQGVDPEEVAKPLRSSLHREALRRQELDCVGAVKLFDRLCALKPDARCLSDRAVCQYRLGRRREALESLESAVKLDRAFWPAWRSLEVVYASLGRPADAARAVREAARHEPSGGN